MSTDQSMSSRLATWRTPIVLLMLLTLANQISFQTWMTLLNNFAHNEAGFTGREIGLQQTIREIPGFLAFGAVLLILFMREQTLAFASLLLLALGAALTGFFPTATGIYVTTLVFSTGFHYFETMNQSLALQWLPKGQAAHGFGRIISAESLGAIAGFCVVYVVFTGLGAGYVATYLTAAALTLAIVGVVWLTFPYFPQHVKQHQHLLMRPRYWLYYLLTLMEGARRQIFIVFASFMMVEKFGYGVTAIATLFLANQIFNMLVAPAIGRLVARFGDRAAMLLEYAGLFGVFTAYAFVTDPRLAVALYLIDNTFFALSMASKTYFQKIADPADIAPTAAVAFSINHIAAIFLPVVLGIVWVWSPKVVFLLGAALAAVSFLLACLVPAAPAPGREWIGARALLPRPAE